MTHKVGMSSLLIAGVLAGLTGCAGSSNQSHPVVASGETLQHRAAGETSQQRSQQGLGLVEGADSSSVILGGPELIFGRIERVEDNNFTVQGNDGQFMKLQLTKDTNMVCTSGSEAKLMTGRQDLPEQTEIPISPATEEQMKSHDPSRLDEQLNLLNNPNRQQAEYETPAPSKDPSRLKDVVGSTDEAANKDIARGSGFVIGGSDCKFKPGDLVRIEASDVGTITTIASLPYEEEEKNRSQVATEKDEEPTSSAQ
jgi:hypothetical protein